MSIQTLPPLTVDGTSNVVVPITGQLNQLNAVRIGNESDVTFTYQWGGQKGEIYPSERVVLRPDGSAQTTIVLAPLSVLSAGLAITKRLVVEFAYKPDDFESSASQHMARLSQSGSNSVMLKLLPTDTGIYTSANDTAVHTITFPIESGTQSIRFRVAVVGVLGWGTFKVYGNNSVGLDAGSGAGIFYFDDSNDTFPTPDVTFFDVTFRVDPIDTAIVFQYNIGTLGGGRFEYSFSANLSVAAMAVEIQGRGTADNNSLIVSSDTDAIGAPWQQAYDTSAVNASIAGGGGTATMLPAPFYFTYLHGYVVSQDGTNALGRFTISANTMSGFKNILDINFGNVRRVELSGDRKGLPITTGLTLTNFGAGASFIAVTQDYSLSNV